MFHLNDIVEKLTKKPTIGWSTRAQQTVFREILQRLVELVRETNTNGFSTKICIFLPSFKIGCGQTLLEI